MNGREWERYARGSLLGHLPKGFAARRRLVVKVSDDALLSGVLCEPSGFSADRYYVNVFVQPLYVPSGHLVLDFGQRVGGGSRSWTKADLDDSTLAQAILGTATGVFSRLCEPAKLATAAEADLQNVHHAEVAGRSWFVAGDLSRAIKALTVGAETHDDREWALAIGQRCEAFADLAQTDPAQATAELQRTIKETKAALGLGS